MKQLNALLQQAKLGSAIDLLVSQLHDDPTNLDLRSRFIELLCVDGQLERADKQLDMMVRQHPQCLAGASSLRQLIRAAQARIDFSHGANTVSLVRPADEAFSAMLELRLAISEDNHPGMEAAVSQLDQRHAAITARINGQSVKPIRDLDDTLAGYLELFGTNGHYYLVPVDAISRLRLQPVSSLVELAWRKVEIEILDGPSGDAYLPITYLGSDSDAQKLGRETDWRELDPTRVVQGLGQKMWLVGEEAVPITQLGEWQSAADVAA